MYQLFPIYDDESETNHLIISDRLLFPLYKAINSESHPYPIQTTYRRVKHFYKTSNACSLAAVKSYADHYAIHNSLNKAFFFYSHLIVTETYENLHKQAIKNYFSCMFEDDILVGMHW